MTFHSRPRNKGIEFSMPRARSRLHVSGPTMRTARKESRVTVVQSKVWIAAGRPSSLARRSRRRGHGLAAWGNELTADPLPGSRDGRRQGPIWRGRPFGVQEFDPSCSTVTVAVSRRAPSSLPSSSPPASPPTPTRLDTSWFPKHPFSVTTDTTWTPSRSVASTGSRRR